MMVDTSLPRSIPGVAPGRTVSWPRGVARRLPRGEARRRLLWRGLSAPFWLGSDVPAPTRRGREANPPRELGLAGELVVGLLDRMSRRLWLRHALNIVVRAAWLGLAVGCLWLLVELAGGPAFEPRALIWVAATIGGLGVVFAALSRPSRRQTARMLDRSFALQERMTTAVDHLGRGVPKDGERASVVYLQMADAANTINELRHHRALGFRLPVRELVLAVACGLLLAALYFLRGVGGDIPAPAAGAVPVFTPAVDRPVEPTPEPAAGQEPATMAPTVEEVQQRSERSHEAQRDLQALAEALDDHAVTRAAAEAIGSGEYERAADDLRELASAADRLSPTSREELARDLDQAATQMSPGSEDLSGASREAAEGLRAGEQAAQEGVRELGEAVDRTGREVASQEELSEQMRQAEEAQQQGRAGQPGEPGQEGQQGAPGDPRQGQGQPGQPGEGQPGEPGEAGQPGEGAQPGQQSQPAPGQEGGQGGQPGEQPGQQGEGQGGQPGNEGGQPGQGGEQAGEGARSEQGGGAGSGEGDPTGAEGQPGAAGESEQPAQGAPAEQRVTEGSGAEGEAGEGGPVQETIRLPQATSGEGIQTSNDSGSSRQGSGSGVTAGSGSAVQGTVGEAGPDSNRVPPAYRSVVERYFSDGEEGG